MIVIVTGGRDYTMRAYDWLRLDALHFEATTPPASQAVLADLSAFYGGDVGFVPEDERAKARGYPGPVTAVYEGEADGADTCARAWAASRGIPVRSFEADWSRYGPAGGPRRNAAMLAAAVVEMRGGEDVTVVAFPGGVGTADCVERAQEYGLNVLDYRGGPAQRWTAEDVKAAEGYAENEACGGDSPTYYWPKAIAKRWLERGAGGVPLVSAHLWTTHGRVNLPSHGALYIGRQDHRQGFDASPLCNPFRKTDGVDVQVLLERYRDHLRRAYKANAAVRGLLHSIRPWTMLTCWCHADKPCHGTVVADAAMQAQATAEINTAGRELPAKHWSAYRKL